MVQRFLSPLQPFTLESLVALEQWSSVQGQDQKKNLVKRSSNRRQQLTMQQLPAKNDKSEL